MPDSLQPHGLYSPWNSPGQNTGVCSLSLPGDLPNPGIELRSLEKENQMSVNATVLLLADGQ